ncbi:heme-binding protein [Candidatus Binatia bacterium]|jgi:glc operon protein GlcG|nr:heme-binding protein [Candidatus Binatia bacterium]
MRTTVTLATSLLTALLATRAGANSSTAERTVLTIDGAKKVASAAAAEANAHQDGGSIAVVDEGGNLIYLERLEGTFPASANVSIGKARTAALFQKPTAAFEDIIKGGRTPMIALADFTPLQGGVPIVVDGKVIGAVGVSGAASQARDEAVAQAGAAALQ